MEVKLRGCGHWQKRIAKESYLNGKETKMKSSSIRKEEKAMNKSTNPTEICK